MRATILSADEIPENDEWKALPTMSDVRPIASASRAGSFNDATHVAPLWLGIRVLLVFLQQWLNLRVTWSCFARSLELPSRLLQIKSQMMTRQSIMGNGYKSLLFVWYRKRPIGLPLFISLRASRPHCSRPTKMSSIKIPNRSNEARVSVSQYSSEALFSFSDSFL